MSRLLIEYYKSSNGKTYCLDKLSRKWIEFVEKEIEVSSLPQDVLEKYMQSTLDKLEKLEK